MKALRTQRLRWEERRGVSACVVRATGLRLRWDRLDDEEQVRLAELSDKAADGGGFNTARLSAGERAAWEGFVEKAAAAPGTFAKAREAAATRAKVSELAARARRPARRPVLEEEGSVTLPREWVLEFVRDNVLRPEHVAVLVYILSMFENGETLSPGTRFEGDTLLISDLGLFSGRQDPRGRFANWRKLLKHLEANSFVEVERKGPTWRVRLGSRTLRARKRAA